jgi:hypothetical protein
MVADRDNTTQKVTTGHSTNELRDSHGQGATAG